MHMTFLEVGMFVCLFVCFSCIREVRLKKSCLASGTENNDL